MPPQPHPFSILFPLPVAVALVKDIVYSRRDRRHGPRKPRPGYRIARKHTNPVAKVFELFGGPSTLHKALRAAGRPRSRVSVYKWTMPKPQGSGGRIPRSAVKDVIAAARVAGVTLRREDLEP